ncbi:unnamed protein product [Merluccius merluccius]
MGTVIAGSFLSDAGENTQLGSTPAAVDILHIDRRWAEVQQPQEEKPHEPDPRDHRRGEAGVTSNSSRFSSNIYLRLLLRYASNKRETLGGPSLSAEVFITFTYAAAAAAVRRAQLRSGS